MLPKRSALLVIPAAAGALALAGCGLGDDGPRTTQARDVAAFTRIDSQGSVDVQARVGSPQRVEVRAGEDVVGKVTTEVRDGTLRVDADDLGWGPHGDVEVVVTVPRLAAVRSSGSGDITAEGIRGDVFAAGSDGSGDLRLAGAVGRLEVETDGSGDADATRLRSREADVRTSGSGDVDVAAARVLGVSIDGSGDVHYRGEPRLTTRLDGSGDLQRAD